MSFIADLKNESGKNVIFAMEEPEIALPPYTQRRIIDELFSMSHQVIATSHSPYVAERFIDKGILVLRNDDSILAAHAVDPSILKEKTIGRDFRTRFAEGLLSKGIIAVEGISDELVLHQVSEKLVTFRDDYTHVDVAGVTIINNLGAGNLNPIGQFFQTLDVRTFVFHDNGEDVDSALFDIKKDNGYRGIEELLTIELPKRILDAFLVECKGYPDYPSHVSLNNDAKDDVYNILKERKAEGYAAKLVGFCNSESELPATIVEFLKAINNDLS